MARKVTAMDTRLAAAVTADVAGVSVSAFCVERGISRQTFYKYRRRFAMEGLDGLEERSRAPQRSPQRTPEAVEDLIVEWRKRLAEDGLDAGASSIQWHLHRRLTELGWDVKTPSQATIWRVLDRRGLIVPEPQKRPHTSWHRFEASAPNEMWQADWTYWVVDDHPDAVAILNYLDDHSRVCLRATALETVTSENAWETWCQAASEWGVPSRQLTDNGVAFSGKLRGYEVLFEANLRAAGVQPVTSRPFHPQCCGKVERFQQTEKKWLRKQPRCRDIDDLQARLDTFAEIYNYRRPHRGIGRITPIERWQATPPITNHGIALPSPQLRADVVTDHRGIVRAHSWRIHVGINHAGQPATVWIDGTHAVVFTGNQLARALELNPTSSYQPSGLPRGRHRD
jgi:transposase InsO family protein